MQSMEDRLKRGEAVKVVEAGGEGRKQRSRRWRGGKAAGGKLLQVDEAEDGEEKGS